MSARCQLLLYLYFTAEWIVIYLFILPQAYPQSREPL